MLHIAAAIILIFLGTNLDESSSRQQIQFQIVLVVCYYMGCIIAAMTFTIHLALVVLEKEFIQFTNQMMAFLEGKLC